MTSRPVHRRQMEAGIFDAAIRMFDERGYDAISVEEICAEAQVGRATFFRYFETKSGLIRELDQRAAVRARQQLLPLTDPSFAELLRIVADTLHEIWGSATSGLRALGRESSSVPRPSRRVFAYTLEVIFDGVRAAQQRGSLDTDLPPELVSYIAIAQLTGAVGWWLDNPDNDLRALLDGVVRHALAGYPAAEQDPAVSDPSRFVTTHAAP